MPLAEICYYTLKARGTGEWHFGEYKVQVSFDETKNTFNFLILPNLVFLSSIGAKCLV